MLPAGFMPAGEMRQRGEDTLSQLSPSSSAWAVRAEGGGGGLADQSAAEMPAAGEPVGGAATVWQGGGDAGRRRGRRLVTMLGNKRAAERNAAL